ncbi:ribonuclease HII [Candidatus Saccharibacteria bacterium]|nr:ribonuclease HII [Candidatus Saccharibacteria bacterium]
MKSILGIDEVGRGPWAGPLVIGAVILPRDSSGELPDWTEKLTDSKKLSKKKREEFSKEILEKALATGLGWVSSREIDELGLSKSLKLATRRAIEEIKLRKVPFSEIVIDGTVNFLAGTPLENYVSNLKKADFLIKEVSAASIIAKVARDSYMESLAELYPGYGFEKHVGYGTAAHKLALETFGPCLEHRTSFRPVRLACGKTDSLSEKHEGGFRAWNTKQLGDRAEEIVADFLRRNGHKIIARNHKTPLYEIDIVSTFEDKIYFTEVKYRKSSLRGSPLEAIDKKKLERMSFAAESFLKFSPALRESFSPLLAAASVSGDDFSLEDWFILEN